MADEEGRTLGGADGAGEGATGLTLVQAAELLTHWGLKPTGVTPVRAAFKVAGAGWTVALKAQQCHEGRLAQIAAAYRHLTARGFNRTAPLQSPGSGTWGVRGYGRLWSVTPWREGREPEYDSPREMAACASTLASFHLAGQGFATEPPLRSSLGKWPDKLRGRLVDLDRYLARAAGVGDGAGVHAARPVRPTDFDRFFLSLGPLLRRQANEARILVEAGPYWNRCRWGLEARPLGHGDASSRNFILGADGRTYLIDLDALKHELPEIDLCRFLRRMLRRVGWEPAAAENFLQAYSAVSPLTAGQRAIIGALLHFPDKPWRLAKQCYEANEPPGPHALAHLTAKLLQAGDDLPRAERLGRELCRLGP